LKTGFRKIALLSAVLLVALFAASFLYLPSHNRILRLPPPVYSVQAVFNDPAGGSIPLASWHIPEKSRFWVATSMSNKALVVRLTNGISSAEPSIRELQWPGIRTLQWGHQVGFTLATEVPDHPWKVELRSTAAWKFVLGPFFITLPPKERIWRSDALPSRSELGNSAAPPVSPKVE
jgi:hypothetical protein